MHERPYLMVAIAILNEGKDTGNARLAGSGPAIEEGGHGIGMR